MFSNIYYDPFHSKIHLWEIINGKKTHGTYPIEHEYYVEDDSKQSPITDIFGRSMLLKKAQNKRVINELKEAGVYTCEGDLSEEVKFLQNRYGKIKQMLPDGSNFNIGYIDIEVASPKEFPKPDQAKHPINLITIKFSKTKESYTFGLQDYTGDVVKNYCFCPDEKRLLENFITFVHKKKPDVLTGWNIQFTYGITDGFDIPYLLNRCKNINVDPSGLSPINIVEQKKNGNWFIAGVSILDYLSLYKNFEAENQESYSLHYISMDELGEGKLEFEGTINTLWMTDWNKFVEYNYQDVMLVEKLEDKLKYLELAYTLAYESLTPFDRVYSSIALLQGLIVKELHSQNKVLPDRGENEHIPFPGAYVFAKVGAYDNVISFDVESLYPHNIMAFNISPETLVLPEETERIDKLKAEGKLILSPVNRAEGFESGEGKLTFDPIYYDGTKKGILPIVVKKIFDERKKFKNLAKTCKKNGDKKGFALNDRLQYTRKILANSLYGVIAAPHFSLYNVKNAMAITLAGQDLIQFLSSSAVDYLMKVGYKGVKAKKDPLVLVDTDSAHYCMNEIYQGTKKEGETYLDWAKKIETEFFEPFWKKLLDIHANKYNCGNVMNFRRENISSKYMILAKKKYAVEILDKEGETFVEPKIKITGIEIVRKDTPSFCREKILEVVKRIFSVNDRNDIMEFMKEIKAAFKNEEATNIAIPKGISDYEKYAKSDEYYEKNGLSYPHHCPIHTRAAINYNYMNRKYKLGGMPIYNGTKMKYIHVTPNNELRQDIIGFVGNYPEAFKTKFSIDYDRQWERSLQDIIERFFAVLGWGEIDLQAQNLNAFMEW